MGLDTSSQDALYEGLRDHVGHRIVCVTYGDQSVAIECEKCNVVLLDAECTSFTLAPWPFSKSRMKTFSS